MENKLKIWIIAAIVALLVAGGVYYFWQLQHQKFVMLSDFAKCIANSGAKFYGAFWCPHCQNEKSLFQTYFESAEKDLPYVECSTADSKGQLEICSKEKIQAYPTWKFKNGSVSEGELSLAELSEKTACPLPK